VVPDLARKLPGRGLWVEALRGTLEQAVRKGAFSRAAKAQLKAPPDLADQVDQLLKTRLLQALGLARRSGELTWGYDKVSSAIAAGRAAWMIEAADGSADGRRKLLQIAARQPRPPRLIGIFSSAELGLALGLENVIHLAFLAGRGAGRWTLDVERLSGFRPLLPESWREEP
jgi:ribosomal protein L7Ae-like RNA K-turn-binding protein